MAGLHICNVVPRGGDERGEYVHIANNGSSTIRLTGLKLTDYTATQARPHIYKFPALKGGAPLGLQPGQSAFVFTGRGRSRRSYEGDWLLFANRGAWVWNNSGDVAYLRQANGQLIDSRIVGNPARHPNGH